MWYFLKKKEGGLQWSPMLSIIFTRISAQRPIYSLGEGKYLHRLENNHFSHIKK